MRVIVEKLSRWLLNLPALLTCFKNDPDLAVLEERKIAEIMQALFISTGCDYISFSNELGQAMFSKTLLEYSEFITGSKSSIPGELTHESNGALSFIKLVGCTYYNNYISAFLPSFPSPVTLFNSKKTLT